MKLSELVGMRITKIARDSSGILGFRLDNGALIQIATENKTIFGDTVSHISAPPKGLRVEDDIPWMAHDEYDVFMDNP